MAQFILLRGAKQLLTLRGPSGIRRGSALLDLGTIEDGSLLIRDGIIAAVGSSRRIENLKEARNALEIPVNGNIVMPGFIDPRMSVGLEEGECPSSTPVKRKRWYEFHDEMLSLLRSTLQHGTVAAELKIAADPCDLRVRLAAFRQLAKIGNNPVRTICTWQIHRLPANDEVFFTALKDGLRLLARRKLVTYIELCNESSADGIGILRTASKEAKLGVKLFWRGGPPELLSMLLSELEPQAVSCSSYLDTRESSILAGAANVSVFSIGREVFEGPAAASLRQIADAGGAIALSTGYHPIRTAIPSMQVALALAITRMRLTPEEAITAATINAAYATGYGHMIGSLEVGKRADVLVLNLSDYREIARQFGINHVGMVIRDGNIVFSRKSWKVGAR